MSEWRLHTLPAWEEFVYQTGLQKKLCEAGLLKPFLRLKKGFASRDAYKKASRKEAGFLVW